MRHERDVDDDVDELQLRKVRNLLQSGKTGDDFSTSCNCGSAKNVSTAAQEKLHDPHNRDIDHLKSNSNWRISVVW